jgi:anaerobic selenocysteine-containing dehydrogenase
LQFQRPQPEIELSKEDAQARGLSNGQLATVTAAGVSVTLRVRISNSLRAGVARAPEEHVNGLQGVIDLARAEVPA